MSRRVLIVAACMLAMGTGGALVHAQDGLRSASLPERPVATPPPGPGDLFRAGPGTYVPHERPEHDRPGPHPGGPFQGYGGWWPYVDTPAAYADDHVERSHGHRSARADERHNRRPHPDAPQDVSPPPVSTAGVAPAPIVPAPRRTFYVIPRCYAGDRPPDATIRCDRTKLRTIR